MEGSSKPRVKRRFVLRNDSSGSGDSHGGGPAARLLEPVPGLGEARAGGRAPGALALDEAPGGERRRRWVGLADELAQALLGDGRVLVLAEHVLELLRAPDEARRRGRPSTGAASSAAYRARLARMRVSCSSSSAGTSPSPATARAEPLPLAAPEVGERAVLGHDARTRGRLLEAVEQREVAVALERLRHLVRARRSPAPRSGRRAPRARRGRPRRACPPRRAGTRAGRRGRAPARARPRASAARSGAPPPTRGRGACRDARRNARERRAATRIWWTSSTSPPTRTPGSCRRSCASCAREERRAGRRRRSSGRRRRRASSSSPSACTTFGRASGRSAPARARRFPIRRRSSGSSALDELRLDLLPGPRHAAARRAPRPSRGRPRRAAPSSVDAHAGAARAQACRRLELARRA